MKTPRPSRVSAHHLASVPPVALPAHLLPPSPISYTTEKLSHALETACHSVPAEWQWHYRTLTHLRDRIRRAHTEHTTEAVAPLDMGGIDAADSAQDQLDRDLLWAELGAENDRLFEIDCALSRMRDGVYGRCEAAGQAIPLERLRAVPWTRYCRHAAEAYESRALRAV